VTLGLIFAAAAAGSLLASWLLVSRLERIGERLGLSEALLGIVAALAADAPEITAAIAALTSHQQRIGAGVVLGSNVFNLAALLGLGAVVAGRIGLHRRVVALSGSVALWVAAVCVLVVGGALAPLAGLILAAAGLTLYLVILGTGGRVRWLRPAWRAWLRSAVAEEEVELEDAIRPQPGRWPDVGAAAVALAVVVGASIVMERAAASLGRSAGIPEIITGGLVLAAVTSLPNAVAAVYLASRGRGAATLSTALNSNTLNVVAGLLLPGAVLGLGAYSGQAMLVTLWYAGLTLAVLLLCWRHNGLGRGSGATVIAAYAAFVGCAVSSGYVQDQSPAVIGGLSALSAAALAAALLPGRGRPGGAARSDASLLPRWTARQVWLASLLAVALAAAADAATGHRVVLIGLLVVGPCLALLSGRWLPTAATSGCACGLAVVLGWPDGIWATGTHLSFVAAIAVVAAVATGGAAMIDHARRLRAPDRR
jgi:cation:H+ antiporter